jgi:hypothetical protein
MEIRKKSLVAAAYISNIPPESYADFAFPYPRFGHVTSNIVESLNGAWKTLRHLPPLRMLVTIWSTVMETFCERRDRLQKDPTLTDSAKKGFDARYAISRRWRILSCNSLKVEVINESGKEFVVDLIDSARSCSCGRYVEYDSPCTHATVAARYLHIDPYSLFGHHYTIFCYRLTYQAEIPPLLSQGLKMDDMLPPLVIQKRGRPQKQRLRKRVQKQSKQIRCSNPWCRQLGHNKRKCTTTQKEGMAIDRNFGYDAEISAPSEVSSDEAESGIIAESPIVLPLRRSQRQRGL